MSNRASTNHSIYRLLPTQAQLHLRWLQNKWLHPSNFSRSQKLRQVETTQEYSLKPFDQTRSIFVHVPKCAGISVNKALYGNLAGGHRTLDQYTRLFEPQALMNYFKFTIVRNPWDRVVSAYHFLQRGGLNQDDATWFNNELSQFDDFNSFVENWLCIENARSWYHFKPQVDYICSSQCDLSLDFIGYFENIEVDFQIIANKIGCNATLGKTNKGSHIDYRQYYTDQSAEKVAKVYEQDIAFLEYNFDSASHTRTPPIDRDASSD